MRTPASIAGHPIHPMLVPIPIGLWIFSLVCDLIAAGGSTNPAWQTVAFYSMGGGIVGALLAAIFGLIDLLSLPPGLQGLAPGMFARAWLPVRATTGARLFIPTQAVVRRAEMTGAYVVDAAGRALLRQVRLGPSADGRTEVLAGLSAGERVALDPQAAARLP